MVAYLAVIGVLNSLVSADYYVGVLVRMYMVEGVLEIPVPSSRPYLFATLLLTIAGTILVGLFPGPLFELARQSNVERWNALNLRHALLATGLTTPFTGRSAVAKG